MYSSLCRWSEAMSIKDGHMKTTHHKNNSDVGSSVSEIGSRRLGCVYFDMETVI